MEQDSNFNKEEFGKGKDKAKVMDVEPDTSNPEQLSDNTSSIGDFSESDINKAILDSLKDIHGQSSVEGESSKQGAESSKQELEAKIEQYKDYKQELSYVREQFNIINGELHDNNNLTEKNREELLDKGTSIRKMYDFLNQEINKIEKELSPEVVKDINDQEYYEEESGKGESDEEESDKKESDEEQERPSKRPKN